MEPVKNGTAVESGAETTTTTTTPAPPKKDDEVTKRSLRVQCWKKFQEAKCAANEGFIFNRITNFVGADKAAQLLADTQEFKNAKKIKINLDRSQEPIKQLVLEQGKELYVAPARSSEAILARIIPPADADAETMKKVIFPNAVSEFGTELLFDTDLKLDMLVIGSVAVSREGHHIGKGNGYVDLDFGILAERGIITKDTLIVTTVHDIQVSDKLPAELFKNYDVPVDMIVTPTEVIRVANRLPRPLGIEWKLLSERRLGIVPVLKVMKEHEEKVNNKVVVLKEEDTDIESNRKTRAPRKFRRRRFSKKVGEKRATNGDIKTDGEGGENRRPQRRPRRYMRSRDNKRNGGGGDWDNTNDENAEGERDAANGGEGGGRRGGDNRGPRRRRPTGGERGGEGGRGGQEGGAVRRGGRFNRSNFRDRMTRICFKLSNVQRESRARDIKQSLRDRQCNPNKIVMKGDVCYVHYYKPDKEIETSANQILDMLADLSIKSESGERPEYKVQVELMKLQPPAQGQGGNTDGESEANKNRIETTDVTAV